MRTLALTFAACGALLLAGCGIKGPLYYPQIPKPAAKPADAAPAPARPAQADHNKPASQDPAQ